MAELCPATERDHRSIKLVTMGIGSLIWERHGHIAVCACGESPDEDECYNYGIGDFAKPVAMGWGFLRGEKSFWAGKEEPMNMLWVYVHFDRSIWVQDLHLTEDQRVSMMKKLESDVLEENRYYAYDHFADNCTTRIRDIIDNTIGGKLKAVSDKPTDGRTFRDLARAGFYGMEGPLLVTDIAMGRTTDRVPTYWERMFLPEFLRKATADDLGIPAKLIYERKGPPALDDSPSGRPWIALIALLLGAPCVLAAWRGRFQRSSVALAVIPPVLLGLVMWMIVIISPLPYLRWNEVILVFFPFDLCLFVLSAQRRVKYARGRVAMLVLMALLMAINVLKQPLWPELLFPLVPALVVGFWGAWRKPSTAR
ncbi:MAG TPA: DUF4105 domain-containing protein [Kofleriaceae bacterium]